MYLLLDTSTPEHFTVALAHLSGQWLEIRQVDSHFTQSEKILPQIEKLLDKRKIDRNKIDGIFVVSGPGGFTSLRIGVITADTLGYAWQVPVIPLKTGAYDLKKGLPQGALLRMKKTRPDNQALPDYGRPPNITKPRRNVG